MFFILVFGFVFIFVYLVGRRSFFYNYRRRGYVKGYVVFFGVLILNCL